MNINDIKGVQISLKEVKCVVERDFREEESREMFRDIIVQDIT